MHNQSGPELGIAARSGQHWSPQNLEESRDVTGQYLLGLSSWRSMWIAFVTINPSVKFSHHPNFLKLYFFWYTVCMPKTRKSIYVLFANNYKAATCVTNTQVRMKALPDAAEPLLILAAQQASLPPLASACAQSYVLCPLLWAGGHCNSCVNKWNHGLHCFVIWHSKASSSFIQLPDRWLVPTLGLSQLMLLGTSSYMRVSWHVSMRVF